MMSPDSAKAPSSNILDQLHLGEGHCAIVGLQWGDEGKGKIVDLLTEKYDLVVRYNGGANAGHSVQVGDVRYALHLIPSGILYPDKLNVLGNGVVVDPEKVVDEIEGLRQRNVQIGDNFRISDRAHVVLPYHKLHDALLEALLTRQSGDGQKIGTTGRGIGPCYADKAQRSTAIRMGELLREETLREKLVRIIGVKNLILGALARAADVAFTPVDADAIFEQFRTLGRTLAPHVCDTTELLHDAMARGKRILFEGANATLLDIDHGTYPFVTSSNCSSLGVHTGTGVPGHQVPEVLGILKAYQTRVGGGPMPTELFDETGNRIREAGREYGTTTGRPRRCGWLDVVALRYAARVSGATTLAIMLLDVLAGHETLRLCTGYRYRGETLRQFPADAAILAEVEPIYEEIPGFAEPIENCTSYDRLPANAQGYIRTIEKHVGVPVRMISVGPRRSQTLVRRA